MAHGARAERSSEEQDPRQRVLSLLRRHGRATTSFQALGSGMRYVFLGEDACIAYVDTGGAWVAAGPPICAEEAAPAAARDFLEEARRAGRRGCFFSVDRSFCQSTGLSALSIGEEPLWDVAAWPGLVRAHRGLREQIRRARAKGVVTRVPAPEELATGHETRAAAETLIAEWLASRPLAPMGFLVAVEPFRFSEERLYILAMREGRLVAFLAAVPVYAERGFFVEHLLRARDAPNGTAEILLDHAFRELAARGAEVATLGLAPLSGDEVSPVLKCISRLSRSLYSFEGVHSFKARLHPSRWRSQWLGHPSTTGATIAVMDSLAAFAPGGFVRFGLRTLRKHRFASGFLGLVLLGVFVLLGTTRWGWILPALVALLTFVAVRPRSAVVREPLH